MTILDLVLIIGILTNVVKGADLILRPHQQKWINDKFESLTLWLDYAKPLKWFSNLATSRGQIILILIGSLELVAVAIIVLLFKRNDNVPRSERLTQILVLVISLLCIPVIVKRIGPKVTSWLFGDAKILRFLMRYILLIIGGYIILGLYQAVVMIFIWLFSSRKSYFDFMDATLDSNSWEHSAYLISIMALWPFFTFFWILIQVGGIVLWAAVILFLLEVLLKIGRGIAWRITEYNKGAYAALTLILTIFIGIVDLYLKTDKK